MTFKGIAVKALLSYIVVIVLLVACFSVAAPEPAIVVKPGVWTLETRFEQPRQIVLSSSAGQQRYWYLILTLNNLSGQDVDFYPRAELMTDTFQIVPAFKGVSDVVFSKVKSRHQGRFPFLQLIEDAGNKVLQGQDNTIDVVIFWPNFDPAAKGFDIFISGLSNETVTVDHPIDTDQDGNPAKVYLRKTLQLSYTLGGDPAFRSEQKLSFEGKNWVMR